MKRECVLSKTGKLKGIRFRDVSEEDESSLLLRCQDLIVSRRGDQTEKMSDAILDGFSSKESTIGIKVIERLSKYCHTGRSWKSCMEPAQDVAHFLLSDYPLPRLLPRGPEYERQCQGIVDFIQDLSRSQSKAAASEEITAEDAAEISATENLVRERRIMARSRNRDIANKRKEKDNHTCQACGLRLFVNGRFIVDCHHKERLSRDNLVRQTRLKDLITLCPTCHRVAHTELEPLSLKQIKKAIGNT